MLKSLKKTQTFHETQSKQYEYPVIKSKPKHDLGAKEQLLVKFYVNLTNHTICML